MVANKGSKTEICSICGAIYVNYHNCMDMQYCIYANKMQDPISSRKFIRMWFINLWQCRHIIYIIPYLLVHFCVVSCWPVYSDFWSSLSYVQVLNMWYNVARFIQNLMNDIILSHALLCFTIIIIILSLSLCLSYCPTVWLFCPTVSLSYCPTVQGLATVSLS